jgi:predicted RNA-binding Zn ribbon-like protein
VGGEVIDLLQTDGDVLVWMEQAGLPRSKMRFGGVSLSLLRSARLLRENIRSLVEKRKAGVRGDPSVLNRILGSSNSYPQLVWETTSVPTVQRIRQPDAPQGLLAPIAEAAAALLASADFRLIKRCEDPACVLWFCDQTKSHRRRWCSVLLCGNRHKVAAFRKRRHGQGA